MSGTLFICSACGKKVRGHDRGRAIGVELTRDHRVSGAKALELGVPSNSVCPGMSRREHQPAHKAVKPPEAGPCAYCGAQLVDVTGQASQRAYRHLTTDAETACHNTRPGGTLPNPTS